MGNNRHYFVTAQELADELLKNPDDKVLLKGERTIDNFHPFQMEHFMRFSPRNTVEDVDPRQSRTLPRYEDYVVLFTGDENPSEAHAGGINANYQSTN